MNMSYTNGKSISVIKVLCDGGEIENKDKNYTSPKPNKDIIDNNAYKNNPKFDQKKNSIVEDAFQQKINSGIHSPNNEYGIHPTKLLSDTFYDTEYKSNHEETPKEPIISYTEPSQNISHEVVYSKFKEF